MYKVFVWWRWRFEGWGSVFRRGSVEKLLAQLIIYMKIMLFLGTVWWYLLGLGFCLCFGWMFGVVINDHFHRLFALSTSKKMLLFVIFGRVMGGDLTGDVRLMEEKNLFNLIPLWGFWVQRFLISVRIDGFRNWIPVVLSLSNRLWCILMIIGCPRDEGLQGGVALSRLRLMYFFLEIVVRQTSS